MAKKYDGAQAAKHLAQAFKKLKSSLFFGKTCPILRSKIMEYEGGTSPDDRIDFHEKIDGLANMLEYGTDAEWKEVVERICKSVSIAVYPKHVADKPASISDRNGEWKFLPNTNMGSPMVDKIQLFIDMDVDGFLLGTLWVMLVGAGLDETFGECSYGNRLRKDVSKNGTLTWSPYLFEPYFSQYEKWRDRALDIAERTHNEDKLDVLMLTLDFRSFFYTVDMQDDDWSRLLEESGMEFGEGGSLRKTCRRLNQLVQKVIETYSGKLFGDSEKHRNVLPIGFPPSQIISNWCLNKFDQAINDQINPLFYGRYVDDVIIVEKVERNSELRKRWEQGLLEADKVFRHIFQSQPNTLFNIEDKPNGGESKYGNDHGLAAAKAVLEESQPAESKGGLLVNREYVNAQNSRIEVQGAKVKVFYFDKDAPYALIQQFREEIARNSSAFNLMPNVKSLSLKDSYSLIYDMQRGDSPNKFREVEGIDINSFELSKFLGQVERIGPLLGSDARRERFCDEVLSLLEPSSTIRFYTLWEKLFEIAISFKDDTMLKKLVEHIMEAISKLEVDMDKSDPQCDALAEFAARLQPNKSEGRPDQLTLEVRGTLLRALESYLARSTALLWGKAANEACATAQELFSKGEREGRFSQSGAGAGEMDSATDNTILSVRRLNSLRRLTCETYMIDKYAVPVLPHFIVPTLVENLSHDGMATYRLTELSDTKPLLSSTDQDVFSKGPSGWHPESGTPLFPYIVKANDLEHSYYTWKIENGDDFPSPEEVDEFVGRNYRRLNHFAEEDALSASKQEGFVKHLDSTAPPQFIVSVPSEKSGLGNMRVALANVKLDDELIESSLLGRPNLNHSRYSGIAGIAEQAKREGANMLVLPELCVPYPWLKKLVDFSANNDIAIICGVEHVIGAPALGSDKKRALNLTAVILPYERDSYRFAKLTLHLKAHLAPHERASIENAGHEPVEGASFELYHWRDVWFPVYCCFELTSIRKRSLFSGYADMLVAVEWNKDTNYFSNIMGSLARDLSCCCIQVNNSCYGDSRMTMPDKTELMDLVKVKGGLNSTVLVGNIDIAAIRDCQLKLDGGKLKPPAPDFDRTIARLKVDGALAGKIKNGDNV